MGRKYRDRRAREREFQLDKFSQSNLRSWEKYSHDETRLWVQLYHHLEGLRQLHRDELRQSLLNSTAKSFHDKKLSRIVDYRYSHEPLSAQGSYIAGGRFNIGCDIDPGQYPPFPVLYLAEDYATAYAEKFGATEAASRGRLAGHEFALQRPSSFSAVRVEASLENIFDLTRALNLRAFTEVIAKFDVPQELLELGRSVLGRSQLVVTKAVELKSVLLDSDWRRFPVQFDIPANPQIFGRLLRDAGFEAVWYPSSTAKGHNLAVFVENLQTNGAEIRLVDEPPPGVNLTALNSANFKASFKS